MTEQRITTIQFETRHNSHYRDTLLCGPVDPRNQDQVLTLSTTTVDVFESFLLPTTSHPEPITDQVKALQTLHATIAQEEFVTQIASEAQRLVQLSNLPKHSKFGDEHPSKHEQLKRLRRPSQLTQLLASANHALASVLYKHFTAADDKSGFTHIPGARTIVMAGALAPAATTVATNAPAIVRTVQEMCLAGEEVLSNQIQKASQQAQEFNEAFQYTPQQLFVSLIESTQIVGIDTDAVLQQLGFQYDTASIINNPSLLASNFGGGGGGNEPLLSRLDPNSQESRQQGGGELQPTPIVEITPNKSNINIRPTPGMDGTPIAQLQLGSSLETYGVVTGADGNLWFLVKVNDTWGYVSTGVSKPVEDQNNPSPEFVSLDFLFNPDGSFITNMSPDFLKLITSYLSHVKTDFPPGTIDNLQLISTSNNSLIFIQTNDVGQYPTNPANSIFTIFIDSEGKGHGEFTPKNLIDAQLGGNAKIIPIPESRGVIGLQVNGESFAWKAGDPLSQRIQLPDGMSVVDINWNTQTITTANGRTYNIINQDGRWTISTETDESARSTVEFPELNEALTISYDLPNVFRVLLPQDINAGRDTNNQIPKFEVVATNEQIQAMVDSFAANTFKDSMQFPEIKVKVVDSQGNETTLAAIGITPDMSASQIQTRLAQMRTNSEPWPLLKYPGDNTHPYGQWIALDKGIDFIPLSLQMVRSRTPGITVYSYNTDGTTIGHASGFWIDNNKITSGYYSYSNEEYFWGDAPVLSLLTLYKKVRYGDFQPHQLSILPYPEWIFDVYDQVGVKQNNGEWTGFPLNIETDN